MKNNTFLTKNRCFLQNHVFWSFFCTKIRNYYILWFFNLIFFCCIEILFWGKVCLDSRQTFPHNRISIYQKLNRFKWKYLQQKWWKNNVRNYLNIHSKMKREELAITTEHMFFINTGRSFLPSIRPILRSNAITAERYLLPSQV